MEQSSWKADSYLGSESMESNGSLLDWQEATTTGPYPDPAEFSPYPQTIFP